MRRKKPSVSVLLALAGTFAVASPVAAQTMRSSPSSPDSNHGPDKSDKLADLLVDNTPFTCVTPATIWTLVTVFNNLQASGLAPKVSVVPAKTYACTVPAVPQAIPTSTPVPTPPPVEVTSAPAPTPTPAPPPASTASAVNAPSTSTSTATPPGWGCTAAIAYLSAHSAPGFQFICPGNADGHEAMTCDNYASVCPGEKLIVINDPCPVAYMNEASNSWVVEHLSTAPIDPYGKGC